MSAQTAKILRDAAAVIETHGWCQGSMFQGERSCLVGSLRRAVAGHMILSHEEAWIWGEDLAEAFQAVENHLGVNPARFNDVLGRTQAEVVKELLTVADLQDVA